MNSIGEAVAWSFADAVSSTLIRSSPSVPCEQVSIFALSRERAAVVFFWQDPRAVAFCHDG